jgi:hypothetical protein
MTKAKAISGLLWNTRTKTTHRHHIKQDKHKSGKTKHQSHHRYYTCFFNNGGHPNGTLEMMKGHRTFEQGKIRNLLVKITQIKNQESKKNSSKEAIKEGI